MSDSEINTLKDLVASIDRISAELGEARDLIGPRPTDSGTFDALDPTRRTAARALMKSVEQLQDVIGRTMRTILILEEEDLTGLTARAIADLAEGVGLIGSAERWSAAVKLRNRLVHEYPLSLEARFDRFDDAWEAQFQLLATTATLTAFLDGTSYLEEDDDRH